MRVYMHDEVEQGSLAWFELHRGIPTASEFVKVMAKAGPKGGTSHKEYVSRAKYLRQLAGEIITGEVREPEWGGNRHTERGKLREHEARLRYALERDCEPARVGFVMGDGVGCSPDSFIGAVGGIEIKDVLPHVQIERLQAGTLPSEHKWQVIGSLHVCRDREWWEIVSHSRGLPMHIVRVERSDPAVAADLRDLAEGLEKFRAELARLVEWIEAMR